MEPSKNYAKPLTIVGIIVVIAGILGFTTLGKKADQTPNTSGATSTPTTDTASNTNTESETKYKDGTYAVTGNYISPGGAETVGVTLKIENDVVVASDFEIQADRPISVEMQKQFSDGYKQFVVGKKLDEVSVGKVSGSSLTPKGFNDAVAKIKVQAQS